MKKNNPLKKLKLFKKTIAHLNFEQMYAVHGGDVVTRLYCSDTGTDDTKDCETKSCKDWTFDCPPTKICA